GCTLDAAERIAEGGEGLPALGTPALDLVSSLADKSLITVYADTSGEQEDAQSRVTMLQTIREYAADSLRARGEAEQVMRLHLRYFVTFAERAEVHLRGPEQHTWLELLDKEHDNLRAALACSKEHENEFFVRLAGVLSSFW